MNKVLIVFLLLLLTLSACGKSDSQQAADGATGAGIAESSKADGPAKISAFVLSADAATKAFEQGAQLALAASPAPSFEIKFLDASSGVTQDGPAFKSAVEKEKAPAVLYWNTEDVSAVAPYLTTSDVVGIVAGDVNEGVIKLGSSIFGFGYSTELTYQYFAKFAGKTLKSYRFGIITETDPASQRKSAEFIEESKSLGNTIVFEEKTSGDSADFSALVAKATKENCDTLFASMPAQSTVKFIRAARANKFKGKILVADTLYATDIASLGPDAEGIYFAQAFSEDAPLKSQYSAKFGTSPDPITLGYAALGYDTIKCLQGISAPLDASGIKYSFLSNSCEGLTGKTQFTGERISQRRKKYLTVRSGQLAVAE